MKKLESMPRGKFIVIIFACAFTVILACGLIALFSDVLMGVAAIGFSIIPLAIAIFHIRTGFLSYIIVSELGISDSKGATVSWENVRFTLYISDPRIYYSRGQVDVLYIDDHYLTADEIKKNKTKSFVVVMPKLLEYLLSKYNNKIQFINSPCVKRHKEFIEHNESFEQKQI